MGVVSHKHHGKTSRKQPILDIKLGVRSIRNHPRNHGLCRVRGFFRGDYLDFGKKIEKLVAPIDD
jgi:hypothetical protein